MTWGEKTKNQKTKNRGPNRNPNRNPNPNPFGVSEFNSLSTRPGDRISIPLFERTNT